MASLRVRDRFCSAHHSGCCCSVSAHFVLTCSSVVTENFLYAVN